MADVAIPGVATVNPGAGDTVLGVQGGLVKRFPAGTGSGLAREADLANAADPAKGASMVGFVQAGAGAVERSVRGKLFDSVSAEDFGAVGDGVTDDSVAVTIALQAARIVNLTRGKTYYLASDVKIPSGRHLRGNGSTIIYDTAIPYLVRNLDIDKPAYEGGSDIAIDGITFDGRNLPLATGFIGLAHTSGAVVRNCVFKNLDGSVFHPLDLAGNEFLTVTDCSFIDCFGASTLQIDAATPGSMPVFSGPELETASGTRSRFITVRGNTFIRCGSTHECVHLHKKGHSHITIKDNRFFDCFRAIADDLGSTYRSNGPTTDILISGNVIKSSLTGGGIFLDYVKRAVISGNIIESTGGGVQVLVYDAAPKTITAITNANPAVVTTAAAHSLSNGHIVYVNGVGGMTQINGKYFKVAGVTSHTFELVDIASGANVDSSSWGVYTSGGTAFFKTFTSLNRSEDVCVVDNIIRATNSDGIVVDNCAGVKVSGNTLNGYGELNDNRSGIKLDLCWDVVCNGNTVRSDSSGTKDSISLYRSFKYQVSGNEVDRGRFGIYICKLDQAARDYGSICDNLVNLGTTYGVFLEGNATNGIGPLSVNGNALFGEWSTHCVRGNYCSSVALTGNTFDRVKSGSGAVSMVNSSRVTITGNTMVALAGSSGVAVGVVGSGSSGRAVVVGNVIENFATGVDIATSSANYGAVTSNMFISVATPTSVGAGVIVANNSAV